MWSAVLVDTRPEGVDSVPRPKEFTVTLSAGDRAKLTKVVSSGRHPARMITRARHPMGLVLDALPGRPFRAENGVVVARRCRCSLVLRGRGLVGHRELRLWALQCCLEHAN